MLDVVGDRVVEVVAAVPALERGEGRRPVDARVRGRWPRRLPRRRGFRLLLLHDSHSGFPRVHDKLFFFSKALKIRCGKKFSEKVF